MLFDVLGWFHQARASRQAALLSVLAIATEKKLALVPMLDAFADDSRFGWRHSVRDLSDMLQSGASLPDALEAVPGLLPPEAVLAARVGAESGTVGAALRLAAKKLAPRREMVMSSPGSVVLYLVFLTLIMFQIISGIMIYIVPKFQKIFADFGTELPVLTQTIIEASDFVATFGILFIPVVFAAMWFAVVYAAAAGRGAMPLTGPFKILLQMVPRIATGDILRNLSVVVAAGRPLAGALTTMAGFHPTPSIRRRIAAVADDVDQGHDCWKSLNEAGLIKRREAALLASAERVGNLDWALRQLATSIDSRIEFRFNMLVEFISPALLLFYGMIVATVVVGMFMPLIKLLNDLS
jgi:protein transport protein HofC